VSISGQSVLDEFSAYNRFVPKLWTETIQAHRREVGDAILETTAALVAKHGLRAVTMSQIAEETGIGRATLYKYFRDVESILGVWHERHIAACLSQLAAIRDEPGDPGERLRAVLETYALMRYEHHDQDLAPLLHQSETVAQAHEQLSDLIGSLLQACTKAGTVRDDIPPAELATYCLYALGAAPMLRSGTAVRRLVAVTLAGLQPSR
jgi:AcrR family transcriptional regulator